MKVIKVVFVLIKGLSFTGLMAFLSFGLYRILTNKDSEVGKAMVFMDGFDKTVLWCIFSVIFIILTIGMVLMITQTINELKKIK